mgnify:CR=1 FL=1
MSNKYIKLWLAGKNRGIYQDENVSRETFCQVQNWKAPFDIRIIQTKEYHIENNNLFHNKHETEMIFIINAIKNIKKSDF